MIDSLEDNYELSKYGAIVLTPPPGYVMPVNPPADDLVVSIKEIDLCCLRKGQGIVKGKDLPYEDYVLKANQASPNKTSLDLEREFLNLVEVGMQYKVNYASDQKPSPSSGGSAAPTGVVINDRTLSPGKAQQYVAEAKDDPAAFWQAAWNPHVAALLPKSALSPMVSVIPGINSPWLYMGMRYATFALHVEDHHLYSLSYLHTGAAKHWYVVPEAEADKLEALLRELVPELFKANPAALHSVSLLISPLELRKHGIRVYKIVQAPGTIVITAPRAYHAGWSEGFNTAEAINLAPSRWLQHGRKAVASYRAHRRPIFSHDRLVLTLCAAIPPAWTAVDVARLKDDLVAMLDTEEQARITWQDKGFQAVAAIQDMPHSIGHITTAMREADEKHECRLCFASCYLSYLTCGCCKAKTIQCLLCRHYGGCARQDKKLHIKIPLQQIRDSVAAVEQRLASLISAKQEPEAPGVDEDAARDTGAPHDEA